MEKGPFVTKIDLNLAEKLQTDLLEQGFEISQPVHTIFSAKKKGISCSLFQSGKLVVQGKDMASFLEFYLEPLLGKFDFTYSNLNIDVTGRIGIDESGKGDYFGPLCIAGVFAEGDQIIKLKDLGVKDSKAMSESAIKKVARLIKENYTHHIVKINPLKYNELYSQFGNLNLLLAWGHATAIENLVLKTKCENVLIDQFAAEHVVLNALKKKGLSVSLSQRHRGEEDLVVAAASILARNTFVESLEKLSQDVEIELPKGASSATIAAARKVVEHFGREALVRVGKLHFKTTAEIIK